MWPRRRTALNLTFFRCNGSRQNFGRPTPTTYLDIRFHTRNRINLPTARVTIVFDPGKAMKFHGMWAGFAAMLSWLFGGSPGYPCGHHA